MATFMDTSLFSHFGVIFVFLFVFVIVYGILLVSKLFEDVEGVKGIYAIIALAAAFFVAMSGEAFILISTMVPWFAALVVLIFLIFLVIRMWGGEDPLPNLIRDSSVYWVLIVLFIIIVIGSLSSVFGQSLLEEQVGVVDHPNNSNYVRNGTTVPFERTADTGSTASSDFGSNVLLTLVNPKVLGLIMLMLIGIFTIIFIAKTPEP